MQLADCIMVAEKHYDKQTLHHALRVLFNVATSKLIPYNKKEDCMCLAMLHDLVEDTDVTVNYLDQIVLLGSYYKKCMELLTRNKENDSYETYIKRITDNFSKYPEAYWVKLADIKDHLLQTETLTDQLKEKYLKAFPSLV